MQHKETDDNKGLIMQEGQLKRKYQRAGIPGFVGNLADGKRIIEGVVGNISTGGFQITNLPNSFTAERHTYTAVLSGGGKHYKILAKPCWRNDSQNNDIHIGFKILDAPWEWVEFTMNEITAAVEN